jgi:hypothetical protein
MPNPIEADCMKFQPFLGWRMASTTHYNKIITGANFSICKGLRVNKLGRSNKSSIIQPQGVHCSSTVNIHVRAQKGYYLEQVCTKCTYKKHIVIKQEVDIHEGVTYYLRRFFLVKYDIGPEATLHFGCT